MYRKLFLNLSSWGISNTLASMLSILLILILIAVIAALTTIVARKIILRILKSVTKKTRTKWDDYLLKEGFFSRLSCAPPAFVVFKLAPLWMPTQLVLVQTLQTTSLLLLLLIGLLCLNAFLNATNAIYQQYSFARQIPISGVIQITKLLGAVMTIVFAISLIIGKSPTLLISGLGAMTAVTMLVFKDPLLGFVAGIQLAANQMLSVGDWLEMPKYGADGDVIDISLTTVKVQNWDKTISTIPTYALISDSFKNWRGMSDSGGRRIKRNLYIDLTSIRFLGESDVTELRKAQLIGEYIDEKTTEITRYNEDNDIDKAHAANGRRLTNIGTFRAYVIAYLRKHPDIHDDMTFIVRQLEPTPLGLPMQIYVFVSDTRWANYEAIQSDIFDHLLAVVPEFGLRLYQQPSGNDLQMLRGK